LRYIRKHFQGRPTRFLCPPEFDACGGARIYLKREDLNHSGAHKLNHCMAEALLAKHMGKTKLIAETGAGQHGVAWPPPPPISAWSGEIHMGEVDIAKEHPTWCGCAGWGPRWCRSRSARRP
jgi:tryptophan synthase beta subunit